MASSVRSLRARSEEWERWGLAAVHAGLSLNAWARRALTHTAALEEALSRMDNKDKEDD
jgi:predicted HicB family RNase H-like nuclease